MNQTLGHETFEEISNYKLIFENKEKLDDLTTEENSSEITDEASSATEDDVDDAVNFDDDSSDNECTALVEIKERRLLAAQTMFKKSIKVSIKSFLISLSLSFLNLFI